uniref:Reverse transcriptase domain-containing protein n=1 Tax=Astyanax mexicanus TaxID=7994 RepID=A0A3B1K8G0_ASTMX
MWQGLQHITDYKTTTSTLSTADTLPDDLNTFYTRFETPSTTTERHTQPSTPPSPPLTVSSGQVYRALRKINPRKAAGPDNFPGRALRACANELANIFSSIFNLSLSQSIVPTCYKNTTIVPLPKRSPPTCLNDYRPVALTLIIMKCFERVVLDHIQCSIPDTLDPLQYAYRPNRSTSDAIAAALHYSLSHLENKDSYIRMLFVDYSSAFNTVIPHKLTNKLYVLGLHPTLCSWLLDFLTGRPQSVRIGDRTSASITTYTGTPQGCVLSPILYTLFTHDCVASHKDNIILKFADDTAVIGRISGGDEAAYRREVTRLVSWCEDNNLALNTDKTKELIVDMRRERRPHQPLFIRELEVERVNSFKYLGIHISEDFTWTLNTTQLVKKAQQRLYFLRRLRKFRMSPKILCNFYSCVIESLLTNCITVWYGNTTATDRTRLQRVVKTAERIIRTPLPSLQSIYHQRVLRRAASILKDSTHPQQGLFTLLPSGQRYRSVKCKTTRLKNSFFPTATRLLNLPQK